MNLDNILMVIAIIVLSPFAIAAGLAALILLTALFAVSMKIIFWVGGIAAVIAVIWYALSLMVDNYGKQTETFGDSGAN